MLYKCFKDHVWVGDYAWCYIDGKLSRLTCNGFIENSGGVELPSFIIDEPKIEEPEDA